MAVQLIHFLEGMKIHASHNLKLNTDEKHSFKLVRTHALLNDIFYNYNEHAQLPTPQQLLDVLQNLVDAETEAKVARSQPIDIASKHYHNIRVIIDDINVMLDAETKRLTGK